MKQKVRLFFSLLCLVATSVVTIATSKKGEDGYKLDYNLGRKSYLVASNCPQALPQQELVINNGVIESPLEVRFIDFGLPMYNFNPMANATVQGLVFGQQRTCQYSSTMSNNVLLDVYSCYADNQFICQVSFERVYDR